MGEDEAGDVADSPKELEVDGLAPSIGVGVIVSLLLVVVVVVFEEVDVEDVLVVI